MGMLLVARGVTPGWSLLINAVILAAVLLFEPRGYHPTAARPTALRPTGERFRDPTSGELVEVWEDPGTGAREYRPASGSEAGTVKE